MLYTDITNFPSLANINQTTLSFARYTLDMMSQRLVSDAEIRSLFEKKEKNKNKTRNLKPAPELDRDTKTKMNFIKSVLNMGLTKCTPDELDRFSAYISELDPMDPGSTPGSTDSLAGPGLSSAAASSMGSRPVSPLTMLHRSVTVGPFLNNLFGSAPFLNEIVL